MAISSFVIPILLCYLLIWTGTSHANGCFKSIISFGDSLADTGNLRQSVSNSESQPPHFFFPPYGETFFHKVTGRCSNGRLIIDFIGESLGLRVQPYERMKTHNVMEIGQGVNFAVIGAYALDSSFHEAQGIYNPYTNDSLGVQLKRFKDMLASNCNNIVSDGKNLLGSSLILMGEIGGNDYNHPIVAGKPYDELKSYVPLVIKTIVSAINDLIELGGKTFVVPGNLPIGCLPTYLAIYYGSNKVEYDNATGCIIELNKLSEYHNELLQIALNQLRDLHPNVDIIYGDYYNAAMQFYFSPLQYGFTNGALRACCGGDGPYNYNPLVQCGDPSLKPCEHPETYVNWDGLHLTEAAYRVIYNSLFHGKYTTPHFSSLCPTPLVFATDDSSSSFIQSFKSTKYKGS
uniref:GDSL esterase/lipase At1g28650-like n=1 Tax=Erigeron canadensis TaxID=72917 RepID=UPI001CB8E3F4|nr:GDSL esterase/lipase At1g28650-like [Erigeron canadensis]